MSISLFGAPQIRRENDPISIQRRKDLALLIYLVSTPQAHSRDSLAALLWPDLNQTDARSNLRKSLSRLKIQLGENCLLITHQDVRLNPNLSIQSDKTLFEAYVHQFREHGHRPNNLDSFLCAGCRKSLEEAALLYQADFLQGFNVEESSTFEDWQFFQSESLRKNLSEVLENLAQDYAYRQDYSTAIEYCRRWLALDELHEPSQRQLMLLYALSGQHAAALRQFESCKRVLKEELGTSPEPETVQLYETIKRRQIRSLREASQSIKPGDGKIDSARETAPEGGTIAHNLPSHPAPFIGREKELEEIDRLLQEPDCRLLTLLAPGGNGKTRLAVQYASLRGSQKAEYKDGIWFIPLAPLRDGQAISSAMIDALNIGGRAKETDPRLKLLNFLRGRQTLLLLDNFEHLMTDDNISLLSRILSIAPRSKLLITSRERLNIQGETIFRVEGLELPAEGPPQPYPEADLPSSRFSALQLFEQCAARVQPSFRITPENYTVIAQICRNVQGMPLAIELAASWLEILSPAEIYAEITRSLDFLESSRRDLPDRQRSLRAVFASSWNLLDRQSRPIVKALSVFRGSFTRQAAEVVSGASAKTLLILTNKSWLQRLSDGRYQIHELLRQFAFEKLSHETASFGQVKKQFCDYYASYTNSSWEKVKGTDQRQAYSGVQAEFENIQTAWMWLVAENKIETAVQTMLPMLLHFCENREKVTELRNMITAGLNALKNLEKGPAQDKLEVILRTAEGSFHYDGFPLRLATYDGVFPIDVETSRRAWFLSQHMKFHELGFWGILLAFVHGRLIDVDEGINKLEQLLPYFRKGNNSWELANTFLHIARLLNNRGELSSQEQDTLVGYLSEAREIFSALGDHINIGYTLSQWGELRYQENDLQGAIQEWTAARTSLLAQGERAAANDILWQISDTYLQLGSFQKAFDSIQELARIYFEHGFRQYAVTALSKESYEKVRYGDISDALRLRQQCLDITQEIGPEYQFGWNYWEMGEIMRVQDRLKDASDWYERARSIFEKYDDFAGTAFYYRGTGDLALAAQDYQAAYSAFSKSEQLARRAKHTWTLTYVVIGQAKAKLGMKKHRAAGEYLEQATRFALKSKDKGITLVLILTWAELFSCLGDLVKAAELGSLVETHFSSWHETRKQASALLSSLEGSMTIKEFNEAHKKGRNLDVWETVGELTAGNRRDENPP